MQVVTTNNYSSNVAKTEMSNKVREPEGIRIAPETSICPMIDRVELSKRGIALVEKPVIDPDQLYKPPKRKVPDNIVDNTEAYREFKVKALLKQGYIQCEGSRILFEKKENVPRWDPANPQSIEIKATYHKFFETDFDFLKDAAEEYAKINSEQDFLYRPTQDYAFVKDTLDWLYGNAVTKEDISDLHKQVDSIVRELAEQIKSGQEADYGSLKNKFSFRGDEISVDMLISVQKTSYVFLDSFKLYTGGGGRGALSIETRSQRGMVKSLSEYYYGNISGGIGKQFKAAVDRILEPHQKKCEKEDAEIPNISVEYKKELLARYGEAYDRFATLNDTDREKMDISFEKNLKWFEDVMGNKYGDISYKKASDNMRSIYQSIWKIMNG